MRGRSLQRNHLHTPLAFAAEKAVKGAGRADWRQLQRSLDVLGAPSLMSEPIEVHIFGAKKGESIVVRLPGDHWGVVDNYTPNLSLPESNPTFKFLQERRVTHLSFLCLTHPHDDHYKGMSHLLKTFRPDRVWLFGCMTHRYLHEKVAVVLKAGGESQTIDSADSDNADELVRILDQVEADSRDVTRNPRLEVRRLQLDMPLLDLGCVPPVRITSLGASGGRVLQYEATLDQCFDTAGGFLTEKLPNVNHNMISGGLLIEYGKARIVLGGDIDREAVSVATALLGPRQSKSSWLGNGLLQQPLAGIKSWANSDRGYHSI